MAGNTPWQAGPADVAGIYIPGPVNFYTGGTPVDRQTVSAPVSTTNPSSQMSYNHIAISNLIVALNATGLIQSV